MISIECHRSGERCPGKREFNNRIEINRVRSGEIDVAIPFKMQCHGFVGMVKANVSDRVPIWHFLKPNLGNLV